MEGRGAPLRGAAASRRADRLGRRLLSRCGLRAGLRAGLVGLLFASAPMPSCAQGPPPSVLILIGDDYSLSDVGAYGNAVVQTPSIDALAGQGMRFTRATTPSPICVPSRGALLTGLYPHTSGIVGFRPRETVNKPTSLPTLLARAGYRTYLVGKDHLRPAYLFPFEAREVFTNNGHRVRPAPERYAEAVRGFLSDAQGQRFFMVVAFKDAHRPFQPNRNTEVHHDPAAILPPPSLLDTPGIREELSRYYDSVARMDRAVGLVLQELESAGRTDDTLVIFTSDHGASFPFAKATLYEAGVRVPFVVRWPGTTSPGSVQPAMISFVDIVPTLMEAAGLIADLPPEVEGMSFLPLLRGDTGPARTEVIGTITDLWSGRLFPSRSIRTDRYKYIWNFPNERRFRGEPMRGRTWRSMRRLCRNDPTVAPRCALYRHRPVEELYDLAADPYELQNLAGDPGLAAVKDDMEARLRAWMEAHRDPWVLYWAP